MKRKNITFWLAVFFLISFFSYLFVFRAWFSLGTLSSGDWVYYFRETMREFDLLTAWDIRQNGMGQSHLHILNLDAYFSVVSRIASLTGMPWILFERLFWFFPFLLIGFTGMYLLYGYIFPEDRYGRYVSPLIYLTNTYILMVMGGGQMGVGLAYATGPLAFFMFLRLFDFTDGKHMDTKSLIFSVFAVSALFMFDIRVAAVFGGLSFLYLFFVKRRELVRCGRMFVQRGALLAAGVGALHLYWILPMVLFRISPTQSLGSEHTDAGMLRFLSFADLSHAFSLLHPNWPENIFGKTYFMRPEFLAIPVLAVLGLLWTRSARYVFFALTACVGAFLSAGTNGEWGMLYEWAFNAIPGFFLFRDPTKFYALQSLSYALILPQAALLIGTYAGQRFRRRSLPVLAHILLIFGWTMLIRQAVFGQMGGTFARHTVPDSYIQVKDMFRSDTSFGRVLWFPKKHRFSFYSNTHPGLDALAFTGTASESSALSFLSSEAAQAMLEEASVAYVVVAEDTDNEFFLTDRRFDPALRDAYLTGLSEIPYLTQKARYGDIHVFSLPPHKPLFYGRDQSGSWHALHCVQESQTHFVLDLPNDPDSLSQIVFTQNHAPGWVLKTSGMSIRSEKTEYGLHSFPYPRSGEGTATVEYEPQGGVRLGAVFSGTALMGMIAFAVFPLRLRKRRV